MEFTFLLPCLNEAETLGTCISKAKQSIAEMNLDAEVLVADNGSTDGSQKIARRLGARVIHVPAKGYGCALRAGIADANGKYVIMGDSDDSYDWSALEPFVRDLRKGTQLVMGCRRPGKGGTIMPGAMPFLHRWLGNPAITALGKLFFRSPTNDFYCGLRGFSREAILNLDLQADGMEFAVEMVIKASIRGYSFSEIPITLHPDGRSGRPHLNTWRDGWRTLRFMLIFCPSWLFLGPGFFMGAVGLFLFLALMGGSLPLVNIKLDMNTMLVSALMILMGYQCVCFGIFAKVFGYMAGFMPLGKRLGRLMQYVRLEHGLLLGIAVILAGLVQLISAFLRWKAVDFGPIHEHVTSRMVISAVVCIALGVQTVFISFFLSLLGIHRTGFPAPQQEDDTAESTDTGFFTSAIGRAHSALVAPRRVRKLAKAMAEMIPDNARVLDVGCGDGLIASRIAELRPDLQITGVDVHVRPDARIPIIPCSDSNLPFTDNAFDVCLLVDVLHHDPNPLCLLNETSRVGRIILVKDHFAGNFFDKLCLRFMDWVGNRAHGIRLPYAYFSSEEWQAMLPSCNVREIKQVRINGLYPAAFSWIFERKMHFISQISPSVKV